MERSFAIDLFDDVEDVLNTDMPADKASAKAAQRETKRQWSRRFPAQRLLSVVPGESACSPRGNWIRKTCKQRFVFSMNLG